MSSDAHSQGNNQDVFNNVLTFESRYKRRAPSQFGQQKKWQDRSEQMKPEEKDGYPLKMRDKKSYAYEHFK